MTGSTVVPETSRVDEADFRNAMIAGLARAQKRVGAKALAFVMDLSPKALGNLFGGTAKSTDPKRMWEALSACPTALDDVAELYGRRLVSKEAVEAGDFGTLPIACLLERVARAESPDSPGGVAKTHQELFDMEEHIRAVHQLTGEWIARINALRAPPRVVSG
jgi:hypothetical protein